MSLKSYKCYTKAYIIIALLVVILPVVDVAIIGSYFVAALIFPTKEEEEGESNSVNKDDENDPS